MNNFTQELCKQIHWRDYHTLTFISSPLLSSLTQGTQGDDPGLVLTTTRPSFRAVELPWRTDNSELGMAWAFSEIPTLRK